MMTTLKCQLKIKSQQEKKGTINITYILFDGLIMNDYSPLWVPPPPSPKKKGSYARKTVVKGNLHSYNKLTLNCWKGLLDSKI